MKVKLTDREWEIGEKVGDGGFGAVYEAVAADGEVGAAKLVPKSRGADRELLFVNLGNARNVVPVIDKGETATHWVLVMPLASKSLRRHLSEAGGSLGVPQLTSIMTDILEALVDLDGRVVHRDLKPENILLLENKWCVADFGISRYAEATTAPDTQKYALSAPYAAPERWRGDRATAATDVYAVGIMAYEIVAGHRPFEADEMEDYRDLHMHATPPPLAGLDPGLAALILGCLYKPAQARPTAENMLRRLKNLEAQTGPASPGFEMLQKANQQAVVRHVEATAKAAKEQTERERRAALADVAKQEYGQIVDTVKGAIFGGASEVDEWGDHLMLGGARIGFGDFRPATVQLGTGNEQPAFDVIAYGSVSVTFSPDQFGYEGRSHSLWYCDAQKAGEYHWYETAFMNSAFSRHRAAVRPFALDPGSEVSIPLRGVLGGYQIAWPFMQLDPGEFGEFVDRWVGYFAAAAQGGLGMPTQMPERNAVGSWRRG
jgi:hypothetical protein